MIEVIPDANVVVVDGDVRPASDFDLDQPTEEALDETLFSLSSDAGQAAYAEMRRGIAESESRGWLVPKVYANGRWMCLGQYLVMANLPAADLVVLSAEIDRIYASIAAKRHVGSTGVSVLDDGAVYTDNQMAAANDHTLED